MYFCLSFIQKRKKEKTVLARAGFTLIELMVASAVFITAMTLAIEALFAAQHSYAKIDGLRAVMDNLNTSFDLMTRDVRYASIFFCGTSIEDGNRSYRKSCPYTGSATDGGTAIMFKPSGAKTANVRKGYYLSGGKVYEYVINDVGATSTLPVTGDDVTIDALNFFVQGANTTLPPIANSGNLENAGGTSPDNQQPVITIVIAGRAILSTDKAKDSYFQLQTTVAARHIDI